MPKALALRAAAGAAALLLLCVAAAPALAQDACYSADQQVNIRSKADICSSSKGSIFPGDIIRVQGSPQRTCYNWQQAEVVSGNLDGASGYFNLDAMTAVSCPGASAPPSNAPCKNKDEQCYTNSECCQVGSGPPVRCQAPDNKGSPKVCSGGAVASSVATKPTGTAVPTATADGSGRR